MDSPRSVSSTVVVDARESVVGRLSSHVAKTLLEGKNVVVINADKAVFSGSRSSILAKFYDRLKIASVTNPRHSPIHYRTPEGILKRVIRGMLPRSKARGKDALKRLRVYSSVPNDLYTENHIVFEDARSKKPLSMFVTLQEISSMISR